MRWFVFGSLCVWIACQSAPPTAPPAESAPAASSQDGPPEVVSVTPDSGSGRSQRFEVAVSHAAGAGRIESVQMLIDTEIRGSDACWVDYRASSRTVALRSDDGASWIPATAAGQAGTVENRQCAVAAQGVEGIVEGNRLKVILPVSFKDGMRGKRRVFALTSTAAAHSGWSEKGEWMIP